MSSIITYIAILAAVFSIGHMLMSIKSNNEINKSAKSCKQILSKMKGNSCQN